MAIDCKGMQMIQLLDMDWTPIDHPYCCTRFFYARQSVILNSSLRQDPPALYLLYAPRLLKRKKNGRITWIGLHNLLIKRQAFPDNLLLDDDCFLGPVWTISIHDLLTTPNIHEMAKCFLDVSHTSDQQSEHNSELDLHRNPSFHCDQSFRQLPLLSITRTKQYTVWDLSSCPEPTSTTYLQAS